jgi:transcriptional regulator with XRE-family HTH domain
VESFGTFLAQKRAAQKISLRQFAEELGVSAPYLSDVEKGRRNALDLPKLELAAALLHLTQDEKDHLYDLAGRQRGAVAPDLPEYIMGNDYVSAALRTARDLGADEAEWMQFIEALTKRREDNTA